MAWAFLLLFIVQQLCGVNGRAYDDPLVQLNYGTFLGKYDAQYNISYFRKIPFAASTAGQNRFRAPQPPARIDEATVYDTDQSFDMCPQRTVNGSEDCLNLGVYSRPWAWADTSTITKRPVLLVFYGGGFIQGSASFTIPPSGYPVLNVSESNDYVVVYSNYRVNAFGFLPGKIVKESPTADLNCALLDQQYALKWIQKHISKFGGDPKNVTIWGQSAGGGSVIAQVIANGGQTEPRLFQKALASSPFWPKTYRYNSIEAENLYSRLVELTGCNNTINLNTLECLRQVDVQVIRNANIVIAAEHTYTTSSFTWAPVIDDNLIRESLSAAARNGHINADFVFSTYNTHEGENFIPPGLQSVDGNGEFNSSNAGFQVWLKGFLPTLSRKQLQCITDIYPDFEKAGNPIDTYTRAGLIYRDLVLACPAYWIANSAKKNGWIGEYTIVPAKHASDTIYWNQVNSIQQSQPFIYRGYAGAMASFIQTGSPNAHAQELQNGTVHVPTVKTDMQLQITSYGFFSTEIGQLKQRCDTWMDLGIEIPV